MSEKPDRKGRYRGEIVREWMWAGDEGGWVDLDDPQTDAVEELDL